MSINQNFFNGSIYHMVHFDNLQSIFQQGMLLSKEQVNQKRMRYVSIAYEDVQSLRDRVYVWDRHNKRYRGLHSYVPFYFATRTPMLYVQYKRNIQNNIVIFEVSRSILHNQGVLFTDGNASNQQLSLLKREKVIIIPATDVDNLCKRRYYPDGPHGNNSNCSEFYGNVLFLDRLQWDIIEGRWFTSDEKKRIKHAEVLVPDSLPLHLVRNIAVRTIETGRIVDKLAERYRQKYAIPFASYKPDLFFQ